MNGLTIELFQQPIFTRHALVFASEIQTRVLGQHLDAGDAHHAHFQQRITTLNREILIRSQLGSTPAANSSSIAPTGMRTFITIGQRPLLETSLVEDISHTNDVLRRNGHTLVISIEECALAAITFKEKRTIISHIYLLKDRGIEIAFSDYDLTEDSAGILNTLNVFNYLRVDLKKNGLNKSLAAAPVALDKFYARMTLLTHTKKIRFIADRVENRAEYDLARSLPFYYFQGDYYVPAQEFKERSIT